MAQYVVIVDHSAGNGSIGEMWKETKIFDSECTIEDVMRWAMGLYFDSHSTTNITLTKPHE